MNQRRYLPFNIFYGWYVLGAAFLVYALGHGLMFSFAVFLKPLSETFQWSRSLIAGSFMIFMTCRALSSILMGGLTDRFGARAVVAAGGVLAIMKTRTKKEYYGSGRRTV